MRSRNMCGRGLQVGHAWLRLHLEDGSAVEHAAHAQREHVRPSGLLQERLEHAGPAWLRLQDGSAVEPVAHAQEHVRPSGLAWERLASHAEPAGHAWLRLQDGSAVECAAHVQEHVRPAGLAWERLASHDAERWPFPACTGS